MDNNVLFKRDYFTVCHLSTSDISGMTEKLFPVRVRCKTCSKKLEKTVIDGLFDSYACAKIPAPSPKVQDAPRHCRRQVNDKWDFKTKYRYEGEVPQKLRDDPATNIYRCDYCRFLHVGHSRIEPEREKLRRTVGDTETLGSVVQRTRELRGIDKRKLAKALSIPAIRITEIERGDAKIDVSALFKVLSVLKIKVELVELDRKP